MLSKLNPSKSKSWKTILKLTSNNNNELEINKFFNEKIGLGSLTFDFTKHLAPTNVFELLISLCDETNIDDAKELLFSGGKINETEDRAVLHCALRDFHSETIMVNNLNVIPEIKRERERVKIFTQQFHDNLLKGYSGKPFKFIVNIGIGGSDLGPDMVVEALKDYKISNHKFYFVNNVDPQCAEDVLSQINLEETLFVVVSKTFTTQETLSNANYFKNKVLSQYSGKLESINNHFIAVTANPIKANEYGINSKNIFQMWDWVNGRFSLWSSVGITIALSIGYDQFLQFLKGAEKADIHFKNTPKNRNAPVIMALLGIWHTNFKNIQSEVIIPYSQRLSKFVPYLQQAAMESNGKSIDRNGERVTYNTSPVIWGDVGTNAQHSFFQMLHQGTSNIPMDIIIIKNSISVEAGHRLLNANAVAQGEALRFGKPDISVNKHQDFEGQKSVTNIILEELSPDSLGALIACYEHKIFVQGIIWNIYSFDQWGVELGKQIAKTILEDKHESLSSSTKNLIQHLEI